MRPLTSTLLAVQRSGGGTPRVRVQVRDALAGVLRPHWGRLYTGGEPYGPHSVALAGDGSLLRARVEPGTGTLYYQRTPSPGSGSDFSPWSALDAAHPGAPIALSARGQQAVLAFVDPSDGQTLLFRESGDAGATWGASTALYTAAAPITGLALALTGTGDVGLFFATQEPSLYILRRRGGSWEVPRPWPHTTGPLVGLSAGYDGDWLLVVAGQGEGGDAYVWTLLYGEGQNQAQDTWSPLRPLVEARAGSGLSFHSPSLVLGDVPRLFFTEDYSGSRAYRLLMAGHALEGSLFVQALWREPAPILDLGGDTGLAGAGDAQAVWLSSPSGVWKGDLDATALDLSGDLLSLELEEGPRSARLTLVVDNTSGQYSQPGQGPLAPLRLGSEVQVSPGYITPAGEEVSAGPAYWVAGWHHRTGGGRAELVLEAGGGWDLLAGWRSRTQYSWASGEATLATILAFLLSRVGLRLDAQRASSTFNQRSPAFTVSPGESGLEAVSRLMARTPDLLRFRGNTAIVLAALDAPSPDYSYGVDHPLLWARHYTSPLPFNRAQAFGRADFAEALEWGEVEGLPQRVHQVYDLDLDTPDLVQERADTALRLARALVPRGEVVVPANAGQELYDAVEVTDPLAGVEGVLRRVVGLRLEYTRARRPRYVHILTLGGP